VHYCYHHAGQTGNKWSKFYTARFLEKDLKHMHIWNKNLILKERKFWLTVELLHLFDINY
jgi:hypothetical protein